MSAAEKVPLTKNEGGPSLTYKGTKTTDDEPTVTYVTQGTSYTTFSGPQPDDYLVMSILTIIFFFWPIGILALVKSLEVRNALARGDLTSAQMASRSARKYNKLAIIIGIIVYIMVTGLVLISQLGWIIPLAIAIGQNETHHHFD